MGCVGSDERTARSMPAESIGTTTRGESWENTLLFPETAVPVNRNPSNGSTVNVLLSHLLPFPVVGLGCVKQSAPVHLKMSHFPIPTPSITELRQNPQSSTTAAFDPY